MTGFALDPDAAVASARFRLFYARLIEIRDHLLDPAGRPPLEPDEVRRGLGEAIAGQGYPAKAVPAARSVDPGYVMAAVADEVILTACEPWAVRHNWHDRSLETSLYGSSLAGERIFAAADALIARRRKDPPTAAAILYALLAGFRGRWLGRDDLGEIARVKAALYAVVAGREYDADDQEPYAAMALRPTALTGTSIRHLPRLWPWLLGLAALILAYFPVSHVIWHARVSQVESDATNIIDATGEQQPGTAPK